MKVPNKSKAVATDITNSFELHKEDIQNDLMADLVVDSMRSSPHSNESPLQQIEPILKAATLSPLQDKEKSIIKNKIEDFPMPAIAVPEPSKPLKSKALDL